MASDQRVADVVLEAVVAECPLCLWRSDEVVLRDEVNAEWHARSEAASQFRAHFEKHRPLPRFVRIEPT
jgi:hypothetical protein